MWNIERIVCGHGLSDKSGIVLAKNQFYGCASRFGGFESFYPITIASLKLFPTVIHLPLSTEEETIKLHPHGNPLKYSLKQWCEKNSGKVIDLSGPGERGHIFNARKYQERRYGPLLMVSNYGSCAIAALVNAIEEKIGKDLACRAKTMWEKSCPRVKNLRNIAFLLHGLQASLSVQKIPKSENKAFRKDPFKWLSETTSGVWIVRVVQDEVVDHVIAIDSERRLVLDSASRYPFRLSEELLQQVGGSNALHLKIAEVRCLIHHPVNTRKRRRVK